MNIPLLDLDRVEAPIDKARGLSNPWYTHESCFITERDTIFSNNWTCVAFTHDVPESGSVYPVNLMGIPLLVVRDREQCVRAFHNVCSHRGVQLVDGAQKLSGMLCCPYHSWTYDLTGRLVATPHVGGINTHQVDGLDCAKHGLKAVRCHEWMGLIFVDLSGALAPFESRIESLLARWDAWIPERNYDDLEADPAHGQLEIELACNWKLAVENYCEAYHLPWVHPGLNTYSRLDDHYNIVDANFSGQGSQAYRLAESEGFELPKISNWPQHALQSAEYISLFPNVLLGVQADHAFAMIITPEACDRTRERLMLMYAPGVVDNPASLTARNSIRSAWQEVFSEDVAVVESMQRGRNSPAFDGGKFSPVMDPPTHAFHQWTATQIKKGEG
mgnify:FL=1